MSHDSQGDTRTPRVMTLYAGFRGDAGEFGLSGLITGGPYVMPPVVPPKVLDDARDRGPSASRAESAARLDSVKRRLRHPPPIPRETNPPRAAFSPDAELPGSADQLAPLTDLLFPFQLTPEPGSRYWQGTHAAADVAAASSTPLTIGLWSTPIVRDWPLEWLRIHGGIPAALDPGVLLLRQEPAAEDLVPTDRLRILILWIPRNAEERDGLERWRNELEYGLPSRHRDRIQTVRLLVDPCWRDAEEELRNAAAEYNVVIIAGHVHAEWRDDSGVDGSGWQTFRGYNDQRAPEDQTDSCIDPYRVAEAIRSTGHVRAALLLGCCTWARLCEPLQTLGSSNRDANSTVSKPVPFVVGTHTVIHLDDSLRSGVEAFIGELARSGRLDSAQLAMRTVLNGRGNSAPVGATLVGSLLGSRLSLLASDAAVKRIEYARGVLKELPDLTLPNILTDDQRRSRGRSWDAYIQRRLQYQVVAPKADGPLKGQPGKTETPDGDPGSIAQERWSAKSEPQGWLLATLRTAVRDGGMRSIGIEADAGMGKSSLLMSIARELALAILQAPEDPTIPLPCFVVLRNSAQTSPADVLSKARASLGAHGASARFALLLDGLDEYNGSTKDWSEKPEYVCVISSRPERAKTSGLPHFTERAGSRAHILTLERLTREEVEDYIRRHFEERQSTRGSIPPKSNPVAEQIIAGLKTNDSLSYVVQEPLFLALLCLLTEKNPDKSREYETAGQLLGDGIKAMMQRRNFTPEGKEKPSSERILDIHLNLLAALAFDETLRVTSNSDDEREKADIPAQRAREIVVDLMEQHAPTMKDLKSLGQGTLTAADLLRLLLDNSGLLVRVPAPRSAAESEPRYRLRDVRVREYLAAFHLNRLINEHGWHTVDISGKKVEGNFKELDGKTERTTPLPCIVDSWRARK